MTAELAPITAWKFRNECQVPQDVHNILVQGEQPWAAYQTVRDMAIFTNKRLIVRDAQGISGNKVEIYTLPYSSIVMYSTENAGGILDRDSEVELWTKAGHIKIRLSKGVDVRKLDHLIASALLA